jgi:hypothetical protein
MVEAEFERRLERLFGDAPEMPDAGPFAARIETRLNKGWTARRWLIGAAGVVGGVIGASQLMLSNVFQRVETAGDSARLLSSGLSRIAPRGDLLQAVSGADGVVWVAVSLAVLMMAFVLTRVIGEI